MLGAYERSVPTFFVFSDSPDAIVDGGRFWGSNNALTFLIKKTFGLTETYCGCFHLPPARQTPHNVQVFQLFLYLCLNSVQPKIFCTPAVLQV